MLNNNAEVEWSIVSLCDEKSVKGLLKHRDEFDGSFNTEIVVLYADLDMLIDKCNLTERQNKILQLYQEGFLELDISEILGIEQESLAGIINTCVKKIIKASKEDWLDGFVYWDILKTGENWKRCCRCDEFKSTSKFGMDGRMNDGFKSYCHKCDK